MILDLFICPVCRGEYVTNAIRRTYHCTTFRWQQGAITDPSWEVVVCRSCGAELLDRLEKLARLAKEMYEQYRRYDESDRS